ncbi:putative isoaspartyl peptidase/L-asparaginase 3 [Vitis vinifera]|uniref:beta-aspartyl-peptidase n=1 Tax=Vitis vinifera TaxID=29760 RepID=A0A438G6L9_VITVI|nr:putative isoaspartyl peptidase/L-asparaginase 3 [Vitis vinifera]
MEGSVPQNVSYRRKDHSEGLFGSAKNLIFDCRVGDGPIAGSSSYADDEVGACGATGDGDIMMRFLPCYQVVESMRLGMEPKLAAQDAIKRIARKFPDFVGAVFAINKNGLHAGACHGWTFQYSVRSPEMEDVEVFTVFP